jgi:aspartate oxidase
MKQFDFVVIGSGIAGLSFALKAAKHGSVVVITKRKGADTNTAWAQGGIACVTSDEDSFQLHVNEFSICLTKPDYRATSPLESRIRISPERKHARPVA